MKTNNNKPSHINGTFGKITLNVGNDGIILVQERTDGQKGAIALSPQDTDKLAKALFAKKRNNFPGTPTNKPPQPTPPVFPFSTVQPPTATSSYMDKQKAIHKQAYAKWSDEEKDRLKAEFLEGKSIPEMMKLHDRNEGAIRSQLKKLGLQ